MIQKYYDDFFKGKKVTVLGLGLLGRGVGDTAFLARHEADVCVTDKKTKELLVTSLECLAEYQNITYHLGEHVFSDFEGKDFIIKAAGVPYDSPYIKHAIEKGIPVYMSAALVCSLVRTLLPSVTIIGVTGTRGKSTTTQLIGHILKESGMRVRYGGNIRGIANLPLLEDIEEDEFLVLELDSWQLQGFGDLAISPHISVFTNFLEDHLNYYKGDKEHYFNDKAHIYRHQDTHDVLIASAEAKMEIHMRDPKQEVLVGEENDFVTTLLGHHNRTLVSLAYEVCRACGLSDEEIGQGVASFKAVEGRLQYMGVYRGVHVVNDNNATTGDAVIVGIDAIHEHFGKASIVICGGKDKELALSHMEQALKEKTKQIVFLSGSGTDRLQLSKEYIYDRLEDCIAKAFSLASEGDVILFSPGFSSFSAYFSNEYERNDMFIHEVEKYH
ncbi:MAG: hypothetical protein RLZZ308_751 [Candidatus Parcubacteria bacterium]|jgi:UDP-N-acetylmuramoylalanine--D-glutamate ligase